MKQETNKFMFSATVSDRGQIFIPKPLQNYFHIRSRDKVSFVVERDGNVLFFKKGEDSK
jgi:AbrB family looped-hinge helix DNA binding protein